MRNQSEVLGTLARGLGGGKVFAEVSHLLREKGKKKEEGVEDESTKSDREI